MAVSSHSGLREEVELRQMVEKAEEKRRIKARRMDTVCGVLDTMPPQERKTFLAEIVRKYLMGYEVVEDEEPVNKTDEPPTRQKGE